MARLNFDISRIKGIIVNLLLASFSILLCVLFLEIGSKILYNKIAPVSGKKVIDELVFGHKSRSTGDFSDGSAISEIEILPYYLYRNKPLSKINDVQQINSEGYRNGNKEFGKKAKGKIRIIAIGGSTTFGWLIKDYSQTWPLQLEKILNEKFNNRFEVVNAGLPAGMSSEWLVSFIMKDKYLDPDIVILHSGGNDLAPLLYDKYYPDYRYHREIIGGDRLRSGEKSLIKKSNFIKLLYSFWMKDAKLSSVRTDPVEQVSLKQALKNVNKHQPLGFERNMNTLIEQIKTSGAIPIIFQFHLASSDVYKVVPESMRYAQDLHPAMEIAIGKNKKVLKNLSEKYKLPYYEMNKDQIPLEYFFDHCHLKPEGDRIKAEFLAQHIIKLVNKNNKE